ncbi:MAG: EAL domain-containing protein [Pseudomonadales bacterium]|nr:EAL domain-containing protein [Pseudomonadales bacterium]
MALTHATTERRGQDQGGALSLDPFEALAQLTRDAVVRVNQRFELLWANRRARTLVGQSDSIRQGVPIDDFLPISSVEGERPGLVLRLSDPETIRQDIPVLLRHSSGRRVPIHVKWQALAENDGSSGWLFVLEPTYDEWRTQLLQNADAPAFMARGDFLQSLSDSLSSAQLDGRHHALLYLSAPARRTRGQLQRTAANDEPLLQFCKLMHGEQRNDRTIARMQVDEFVMLLHDSSLQQAEVCARGLSREFGLACTDPDPDVPQRSLHIGIIAVPNCELDAPALLQEAFDASLQARDEPSQRICVMRSASTTLRRRREEIGWMGALSRALDSDGVSLSLEPLIAVRPRTACRAIFAVRARLDDESGDEIPNHRLIAAAERFQLLSTLDRWIVTHSLRAMSTLTTSGQIGADSIFAIALSTASLAEPAMLAFLRRRVLESGLPAERVCFEVKATNALANALFATRLFAGLRQIGCRIALDDVGGAESSFGHLKDLPVHYLKIDAELVRGVVRQRSDRAMVEAIQRLATVMSLETIANEVDDETVLACLTEIGLDYVQGKVAGEALPL